MPFLASNMTDEAQGTARPASVEDLKLLLLARAENGVEYLLIAQTIDFEGVPVRTLSLEGLLKTKQTSRDKDKLDRLILEQALDAGKNR